MKTYITLSILCAALIGAFLIQDYLSSQAQKPVVSVQKQQDQVTNSDQANTVEVHVQSKFAD